MGGIQFIVLRVVQALLGTLSCWLLYRIARHGWGEEAGRWALLVSATYLPFLFYSPQVLNSTLYLLLVVSALAATGWAEKGPVARAFVPGLLLGASALTAGTILGAAPALALWLAWRRRSLLAPLFMALACVAVLSPWVIRNWRVQHAPVLIDTNSGGVLYLGNVNYGMWVDPDAPDALDEVKRTTDYERLDEAGKNKLLTSLATTWMKEHPGDFLRIWALKFLHGWSPVPSRKSWPLVAVSLATYGLVLVLGLWGAWKAWRERSPEGLLLIGYLVLISATHAVFVFAQRHRVPLLDPALIVLAASAATTVRRKP